MLFRSLNTSGNNVYNSSVLQVTNTPSVSVSVPIELNGVLQLDANGTYAQANTLHVTPLNGNYQGGISLNSIADITNIGNGANNSNLFFNTIDPTYSTIHNQALISSYDDPNGFESLECGGLKFSTANGLGITDVMWITTSQNVGIGAAPQLKARFDITSANTSFGGTATAG